MDKITRYNLTEQDDHSYPQNVLFFSFKIIYLIFAQDSSTICKWASVNVTVKYWRFFVQWHNVCNYQKKYWCLLPVFSLQLPQSCNTKYVRIKYCIRMFALQYRCANSLLVHMYLETANCLHEQSLFMTNSMPSEKNILC